MTQQQSTRRHCQHQRGCAPANQECKCTRHQTNGVDGHLDLSAESALKVRCCCGPWSTDGSNSLLCSACALLNVSHVFIMAGGVESNLFVCQVTTKGLKFSIHQHHVHPESSMPALFHHILDSVQQLVLGVTWELLDCTKMNVL